MNDSVLLKIALATSLIGVCSLFFILQVSEIEQPRISVIDDFDEDTNIRINGFVEKVVKRNGVTIISISQQELIDGVIFEDVDIEKGVEIDVVGKLKNYKGKKELLIDRIVFV